MRTKKGVILRTVVAENNIKKKVYSPAFGENTQKKLYLPPLGGDKEKNKTPFQAQKSRYILPHLGEYTKNGLTKNPPCTFPKIPKNKKTKT